MKKKAIFFFIFLMLSAGFFYIDRGSVIYAQTVDHLVISEVQITGGEGKTKNDFIEIYNPTDASIDLGGIRLVKRTKNGTADATIKSWIAEEWIPAHGYYLWANSDFTDISTTPDAATADYVSDNNGIALRRGAEDTGEIMDAVAWGEAENIFAQVYLFSENPGDNQSLERRDDDFFLQINPNPQNSSVGDPTPNDPEIGSPDIQAGEIVINELVPDPIDGAEWIELYNITSAVIDLGEWEIWDGTNKSIKSWSGNINPQGFFIIEFSSARLNNSGDIITLKSSDGATIDRVVYGQWNDGDISDNAPAPEQAGQSIARQSNGLDTDNDKQDFALSDQVTKGSSNIIHVTTTITRGGTNVLEQTRTVVPLPKVLINEFVADPEDGSEWVELYNAGDVSVDLDGWRLEEGAEQKTSLSGTLIPGQFKILENINGQLNNSGDVIRLKNPQGEMADKVSYGVWEDGVVSDNVPAGPYPYSVARIKDGLDTDDDKEDFTVTSAVTKGYANKVEDIKVDIYGTKPSPMVIKEILPPLPPAVDVIGQLFINEILPNPEGSDDEEWLELFWNGDTSLNLAGFSIDDKEGGSKPFVIDNLVIKPGGYTALKREITKLAFNNDTDEARLFTEGGRLIDEVEYEEGKEGQTYAKGADGSWQWTAELTPGQINVIKIQSPTGSGTKIKNQNDNSKLKIAQGSRPVDVSEAKEIEIGTEVLVKGSVSVPPGVLGSQIFYIADGVFGLQVYSNKKLFPKFDIGDTVEIVGTLSQAQGAIRIKTKIADDIKVVSRGGSLLAREFIGEEISEEQEGGLIKIKGTVIDRTSSKLVVSVGSGEVPVVIKKTTGISTRELTPGLQVVITGIVGNSASGCVVMPRFQEDIKIVGRDELLESGAVSESSRQNDEGASPYAKATAYAGGGAVLAALGVRRRKLFMNGFRAALFMVSKGNNNGKGFI